MGVGFPHRNNPPSGLFNKIDWPPDFKAKEIRHTQPFLYFSQLLFQIILAK
jgi:hypothetical protein